MTKSLKASSNGCGLQVLPVCQPGLKAHTSLVTSKREFASLALTRARYSHVEEEMRPAHAEEQAHNVQSLDEHIVSAVNILHGIRENEVTVITDWLDRKMDPHAELCNGGYVFDFVPPEGNVVRINVWRILEHGIYMEKSHFKHENFTIGLEHLKRILRRDIHPDIRFEVSNRGDIPLQPYRNNNLERDLHAQELENEQELMQWRNESKRDSKRHNWKEVKRRRRKKNRVALPEHESAMPDNVVFGPHADEQRVVRSYLWESRRLSIHTEYENFCEYRRGLGVRVVECKRMFDLVEVVLARLTSAFEVRMHSTLPGPPLCEDKICEIVLLDQDRGHTFYTIFGWHLPRGSYEPDAVRYFSYWYHHYSLYLTTDQVRSLAFPNPAYDMEPHAIEDDASFATDTEYPEVDIDFEELARSLQVDVPSVDWLFHVENIVLLGVQVMQARSYSSIIASFLTYMKLYLPKRSAMLLLKDLLSRSQSLVDFVPHGDQDVADWWTLLRTNRMYTRIAYLITAAMSLSICSMKEIKWSLGCFDLLALEAPKHQLSAVDLIDTIVKTYTWIAEVGWRIFTTGDLRCLLFEDQRLREFTDISDYVLAHIESAATGNLSDLNDYNMKLDKALSLASEMKRAVQPGPATVWMSNKYIQLVAAKDRMIAKERTTAIRFAPIGFSLSGGTSVGKSTLAKLTMKTSLFAMGFDSSSDRIITHDNADKYQSTYTSDINGMFIDDFANLKSKFQENPPTEILIKFFNNVAAQAIKAEIGAKGNVFINFKCGVLTTNVQDLDVRQYSNCPESILRRFYHVQVKIRPEFTIPDTGMLNTLHPALQTGELTIDVWDLTIYEVKVQDLSDSMTFGRGYNLSSYKFVILELADYKGQQKYKCQNMSLSDYLDVVVFLSTQHKRAQDNVVKRSLTFDTTAMCERCKKPLVLCKGKCWCTTCSRLFSECYHLEHFSPHGLAISGVVKRVMWDVLSSTLRKRFPSAFYWYDFFTLRTLRNIATSQLETYLNKVIDDSTTEILVRYTPSFCFDSKWCQKVFSKMTFTRVNMGLLYATQLFPWCAITGTLITGRSSYVKGGLFALSSMAGYACLTRICVRQNTAIRDMYLQKRDALPVYAKTLRDYAAPGAAAIASIVIILKAWNSMRRKSALKHIEPNSLYDYTSIDKKPGWFELLSKPFSSRVKASTVSKTTTLSSLATTLEKNLFFACFYFPGRNIRCNVFFPRKGIMMFPEHMFYEGCSRDGKLQKLVRIEVTRKPNCIASKFEVVVDYDQCVILDDLDLAMAYVPNSPDIKSGFKWLPTSIPTGSMFAQFMVRDRECELQCEDVVIECGTYSHTFKDNLKGGVYKTALAKNGACMGLLLADCKTPCILGFHIGGHTGQGIGMMQSLTFERYLEASRLLTQKPGVILSSEAVMIPHSQYSIPIITTTQVHPKAKFFQALDETAYLDVIGSTKLRSESKTQAVQSILSEAVTKHTGIGNLWSGPQLRPNWRAFNESLDYIVHPSSMHPPLALERARQDWICPLLQKIPHVATEMHIRPLSLKESILGIPGVRFLDALKMDTSMGFPLFGPKSNYFTEVRRNQVLIDRVPDPCILSEMQRLEEAWKRGERAYPVASATLKDEPTLKTKSKVRVFEAVAVAFGLHIRKYFLPIARYLSLFPILSECAVGINSYSPDWEELMSHAEKYDSEKMLAWDYSKYDLRMNSQMTKAVLLSYIELAKAAGYDEYSLFIMEQMVNDITHPLMDYNGTLIMVYNMNTSGNNITVNINSTANSLYVRMGFFHQYPHVVDFRSKCALMTYGDDGIASVSADCREFNIQSFIEYMGEHDMKVTLPTKDDKQVDFLKHSEVDFLKRKSNYIPEIGCKIGALDEMSIFKSLHCNLKSQHETPRQVAVSVLEGAMHEWFAHGREIYEMRRRQMQLVCEDVQLGAQHMFVSFDKRVQMWIQKYRQGESDGDSPGFTPIDYSQDAACLGDEQSLNDDENDIASNNQFFRLEFPDNNKNMRSIEHTQSVHECLREPEQSLGMDVPIFYPHAGEDQTVQQYTEIPAPESQKQHNIVFEDSRPGYMEIKDGTMDSVRNAPMIQDASLQDFFSRPLKIASYRWGVGSGFFEDFDPWSLYFNNPRVVNRISNFKLMYAKLHVKIIINGTPFHYGRLLASYQPLPLTDNLTVNRALIPTDLVAASQRPHIYINPTSSIGGELLLPFFLPQNVVDITFNDWRLLGLMNIRSMQDLKHANGAVDTVTVSVFAWAEDVNMAVPTQFDPGTLVPQADEYGDSPISKPASVVAAMMKPLMMIPSIAPFARATQVGALAVSAIAKLYGYAKTPLLAMSPVYSYTAKYQWACTDTPDTVNKLTVDSKQELSIDPRTAGLDSTDEMAILNVAKRESFLYAFPWNIGDLEEKLLFNVVVDPCIYRSFINGSNREIHMPACCYAAYPFNYWRGTMRYRFQVVCSNFHRGRLKIVYDPTSGSATSEYNVAYTTIVDISDKTDFTIDVGWGQPYTYKQHIDFAQQTVDTVLNTSLLTYTNNFNYGNGVLSVYVVNELTVPDTTINNNIQINVFVSACDDFEVAAPDTTSMRRLRLRPPPMEAQALFEPHAMEEMVPLQDSIPTDPERLATMAKSISTQDATNAIHFGERILSFRQLAKRYDWHEIWQPGYTPTNSSALLAALRRNMFPYYPGWYPAPVPSITTTLASGNYAYSNFTWLHYISCAYAGRKGGIRYYTDFTQWVNRLMVSAYRTSYGAPVSAISSYVAADLNVMRQEWIQFRDNFTHVGQGAVVTGQALLAYEVPYYSIQRFTPARNYLTDTQLNSFEEKHVIVSEGSPVNVLQGVVITVAGAEDFTTFFFLGAPIFYYEEERPTT